MPLLEVKNVGKDFDGNIVLKNVSFELAEGEIVGLCGENGAGKSTLMNIIFGMTAIRETGGFTGEVIFDGKPIDFKSPTDALNAGIGMVHQEFSLIPGFTAAENVLLNREITRKNPISALLGSKKLATVDHKAIHASAAESMETLEVNLPLTSLVADLPVGHKQFIEIAREINKENVKLLILDEPTAVLTESEAEIMLSSVKKLAAGGISIIFISHRLREIKEICDKVLIMRDGVVVADKPSDELSIAEIAKAMIGRTLDDNDEVSDFVFDDDDIILELENFWVDMPGERVSNANLRVHKGEMLGIGGLAGQGKLGIPNGIMGIYPAGGTVRYKGADFALNNPRKAQENGFAFVSEDRRGVGLLLDEPIYWNIAFNALQIQNKALKSVMGIKFRDDKAMIDLAEKYIDELQIKCTGPDQQVRNLSGGNQQKVCLAKAFCLEPDVLIVSEPTRGIDVGAKQLVLDALRRYNKENGTTIIMVSSELEELRSICDRIAIVTEGEVFGVLPPHAKAEAFGLLMSGEVVQEVTA